MEIILVRHGKPAFDMRKKFAAKALAAELDNYDASGIAADSHPTQELRNVIQQSASVFCSDFRRSIESIERLHPEGTFTSLPLFREAPLPRHVPIPFRQSAMSWVAIARTLWCMGYAGGAESYVQARRRAGEAAQHLIQHTREVGPVALIGHGLMNLFIAKYLLNQGWAGPKKHNSDHWGWSVYQSAEYSILDS